MQKASVLALATLVASIGCSRPVAAPPQPAKMALTGKIAFTSDRVPDAEGINQIFVMEGSTVARLTNFPGTHFPGRRENSCPSFSPDGRKIAFDSRDLRAAQPNYDQIYQIFVMNADGSAATRLTSSLEPKFCPVFSPDGQRIAFEGDDLGTTQIFIMNTDGSGITQLTRSPDYHASPRFSPDGRKIVFDSIKGNLFTMNPDGSAMTRLKTPPDAPFCEYPAYSPDGRKIVAICNAGGQIWVMDADGGNAVRVLDTPGHKGSVVFSPDGRKIAFDSDSDERREPHAREPHQWTNIYLMNTDGSDLVTLVPAVTGDNFHPAFSP